MKIQNIWGAFYGKLKYSALIALIVIPACITLVNAAPAEKTKSFAVIDSIGYPDKGNMSVYGMKSYTIIYTARIWTKDVLKADKRPAALPPDAHIEGLVKNISLAESPVIYDIEHWALDIRKSVHSAASDDISTSTRKNVIVSMDKMIHIIKTSKQGNPSLQYGYYGCLPLRDYWSPVKGDSELLKKWREANDYLKPLADSVDVICPSLYAFFPDKAAWVKYAKANIEEAKRMANGKPVYVYLWPKYHNSNKEDGKKFIEGEFWKLQLETVYASGIAGVIIWDSPRVVSCKEDSVWDSERVWWKETIIFLKRINK